MPKEIIYVDMTKQYPFACNGQKDQGTNIIQVRKTLQYDHQPRFICKEKIRMLKSLGFQNLIGLESTKSEEKTIIVIFEYIPLQFLTEVNTLPPQKINKIKEAMLELSESLASKGIVHTVEAKRIGLDKRYNAKYFLGVDFKIDKTADKQRMIEEYKSTINNLFHSDNKSDLKVEKSNFLNVNDSKPIVAIDAQDFEINVRNLLGLDEPTERKILKKSSILESECSNNDDLKARKASTRFTFNYDNQIRLPIDEKEKSSGGKSGDNTKKMQDLTARINTLKGYMKEIKIQVNTQNVINVNKAKTDQNDSTNQNKCPKKAQNNFFKIQKQNNDFRQSQLRKTSRDQESFCQNNTGSIEIPHKIHPSKSLQQPENHHKTESKSSHPINNKVLSNNMTIQPNPAPIISFAKKNSVNYCEDDRQHQQYVMLANKDDYCAQFMLFLEDNDVSDEKSQRTVKKSAKNERPSIPVQPQCKYSKQRENLKTQSSENTLQIQSRVQKVIRSSLKLINGLRSRQSIRCQ